MRDPPSHHQHARLGHLFDGRADAFAAQSGFFYAAEGHRVEAPAGRVADDQRADFQLAIGSEDAAGVAGEQAGLQAVLGVIHVGQRLLEVVVRLDDHHRTEDLFVAHLHAGLGSGENGRRDHGAMALAASHQLGAALDGLLDPGLDALGLAEPDQRTHFGGLLGGVARDQLGRDSTTFHRKV